ncbi:MAG TPA: hypothetical protein PKL84_13975, partial [Candidatus Hydrogenedentes bacterium]|nr:hypothetical protein [Candidatus Hydrogenedentota bacterium]
MIDAEKKDAFPHARWIWSPNRRRNHYALFARSFPLAADERLVNVRITASYHYELYANGRFVNRGPVHGDPAWRLFDECVVDAAELGDADMLHLAVVVHHCDDTAILCQIPAPPGLIAEVHGINSCLGTDADWKCLDLDMWAEDAPKRGWALPYMEDYDAAKEPPNWTSKIFPESQTAAWGNAVEVDESAWANYTARMTPYLKRRLVEPARVRCYLAPEAGAAELEKLSDACDAEPLEALGDFVPCTAEVLDAADANAFTFDLGRERIGFYHVELDAPEGIVVDISGAELLRDGRPWISRKKTRYSARYRTRAGRQAFCSFGWSGFRYLHVVVRAAPGTVRILRAGCLERRAVLPPAAECHVDHPELEAILHLCRHTLEIGAQEHLIDCPTREQAQYWGDALFIAVSLWIGFGEPTYLHWYLESYLHAPFRPDGQIRATYPGTHSSALLDYSLIPILGQEYYRALTGEWYRPEETVEKSLRLKQWYDAHLNADGLVDFDFDEFKRKGLLNFIDHPGIGWHHFPHPGIDRRGVSAPLNLFFYGFLQVLAEMAETLNRTDAEALRSQAENLGQALLDTFYDGVVFRDARIADALSPASSWQTNALAVYFDLLSTEDAARALRHV